MNRECEILSRVAKRKRKTEASKFCVSCDNFHFAKKKKKNVDNKCIKYSTLLKSNETKDENIFHALKNESSVPMFELKHCSIKLIRLDPIIYGTYKRHVTNRCLTNLLNQSVNFNDHGQNDCWMPIESTSLVKERNMKKVSKASNLSKTPRPCSVVLERLNVNDFSKDFKIDFTNSTECIVPSVVKPCSVKLNKINIEQVNAFRSRTINVKSKERAAKFIKCKEKKWDDLSITVSKEISEFGTSSKNKILDLNLISQMKVPDAYFICKDILIDANSQCCFEEVSNSDKSNTHHVSDFDSSETNNYCSTGCIIPSVVKSCSVKLNRINIEQVNTFPSDTINVVNSCCVKSKESATEFNKCKERKWDDLSITVSKEISEFETSSKNKILDLNLISQMTVPDAFFESKDILIGNNSKCCFEEVSNSDKSNTHHVSNFDSSEINKLNATAKFIECSGFDNDKYLEPNATQFVENNLSAKKNYLHVNYLGEKSQFSQSSRSCVLVTNSEKCFKSSNSFEFLTNEIVNKVSDIKSPVLKSDKDEVCHIQAIKNKIHFCLECNKALPSLKSFYYHLCEGKQKRGYPCKFCDKNFDFYHALRKHKKYHSLKNSLSCSDMVKTRHRDKSLKQPKSALKANAKKFIRGKENNSSPVVKPRKLKSKVFLQNMSDATTSSGCYSSNSNFIPYICNPDDSEVD